MSPPRVVSSLEGKNPKSASTSYCFQVVALGWLKTEQNDPKASLDGGFES